jgi:hypothetical protein
MYKWSEMTPRERDALVTEEKYCNGCKQWKPKMYFPRNKRSKDGFDWRCKDCKREQARKYIRSERGRETRRRYYQLHKPEYTESKRQKRAEYAAENPEKMRARHLVGNAVRRGYIDKPENDRNWHNRWEFHHPDHTRPYYGVWVSPSEHRLIENGEMECPPCTDYTEQVYRRLMEDWGLTDILL